MSSARSEDSTTPQVDLAHAKDAPSELEMIVKNLEGVISELAPAASATQVKNWRASLKAVQEEAAMDPEVVIGFVGITGAGKSTLINALLGDNIVPTSGVKSCTATPIKISYHPSERVSATIEFVSAESWLDEIRACISALVDAARTLKKPDDDRKLIERLVDDGKEVWDRIRVVYPTLTPSALLRSTAEEVLASDAALKARLGTTQAIDAPSGGFRAALQGFAALWPLVAQVAVCCAAPVLACGVALVDLPGVFDSNAARGAVARDYLKRCDRVFVIAPIKRVVTDQVARDLVGQAFKSQLIMDGKYSAEFVTVVATCIDDISCSESVVEFGLDYVPDWTIPANKKESLQEELNLLLAELQDLQCVKQPFQDKSVSAESLPITEHVKRVAEGPDQPPPKRQKTWPHAPDQLPIIDPSLLQSLPSTAPPSHIAQAGLPDDIVAKEFRVFTLQSAIQDAEKQCMRACIEMRNNWARDELQGQFQEGRCALFEGEEMYDDDEEEAGLAVFTVSARDYLRLQAKSPLDGNAMTVCETADETGIPGVIEYCRQIGIHALLKSKNRHAGQLSGIVSQLDYFVTVHSCGDSQPDGAVSGEISHANMSHHITSGIRDIAESASVKVLHDLEVLFTHMRAAPAKARNEAGAHIKKLSKSITHWRTLKALLRRDGTWRQHDWNSEAIYCLCNSFTKVWARILAIHCLKNDVTSVRSTVENAVGMLEASTPAKIRPQLARQKSKVLAQVDNFARQAAYKCKTLVRTEQADISRQMQAKMMKQMHHLYQRASALSGIGVMVQAMRTICEGLDEHAEQMFSSIIEETVESLRSAVTGALQGYLESLSKITSLIETYMPPISLGLEGRELEDHPVIENIDAVMSSLADISMAIKSYEGGMRYH